MMLRIAPLTTADLHSSQVLGHAWVVHEPEKLADVVQERIGQHDRSPRS